MYIGIYGGSFNPIHFGHIGLARYVAEHTPLDAVWLMVTPNNPLKPESVLAPENERLEAARQAIADSLKEQPLAGGKQILVSDFEFSLPRPNYTAQTLRCLRQAYPDDRFALIIGEDNWQIFNRWRNRQEILDHTSIFIYPRKTNRPDNGTADLFLPENAVFLKDAPHFDISSTQLRLR